MSLPACPICEQDTLVLETRGAERRRRCTKCLHTFTTVEKLKVEDLRQQEAVQILLEAADKLKAA